VKKNFIIPDGHWNAGPAIRITQIQAGRWRIGQSAVAEGVGGPS
jgi:hypothetical protein